MKNELILERLKGSENQFEKIVIERLKKTDSKFQSEFYRLWKSHDAENDINSMFIDLKSNVDKFWINERHNKDLGKSFNMLYFEHGGLYGGELEAYAIDFNYSNSELPKFEVMDNRLNYLKNISCFPACEVPLLGDLTREIQGKEKDFGDWSNVLNTYNLYESTALIQMHATFLRAYEENLFDKLNLQKPFYFVVGEHDAGAPKLVCVTE